MSPDLDSDRRLEAHDNYNDEACNQVALQDADNSYPVSSDQEESKSSYTAQTAMNSGPPIMAQRQSVSVLSSISKQ